MNYLKHYIALTRKRELSPAQIGEKHHVFPTSIFGKNKRIVILTTREHLFVHKLLYLVYKKRNGSEHHTTRKMLHAIRFMLLDPFQVNSDRLSLQVSTRLSAIIRQHNSDRFKGDNNPAKRDDVRAKISKAKTGKGRKDMIGKAFMGSDIPSEEILRKVNESKKITHQRNLELFGKKVHYPENRKSEPCSDDKAAKISESRKRTTEKFISMDREEFADWISKQKLYNKRGGPNSNVTRYILARGEAVSEYYLQPQEGVI